MQIRIGGLGLPFDLFVSPNPNTISLSRATWVTGKGPDRQGLRYEGETILSKLITAADLAGKTTPELRALFRAAHDDLVRSEPDTPERRNALASLDNISHAIAAAMAAAPSVR